jgi:hypothetical protein
VEIDEIVTACNNLLHDPRGKPLGWATFRVSRKNAIEVQAVVGRHLGEAGAVTSAIGRCDNQHRTDDRIGVELIGELLECTHRGGFSAVDASDESDRWAFARPADLDHAKLWVSLFPSGPRISATGDGTN